MRDIKRRRLIILILAGIGVAIATAIYAIVPSGVAAMEIVTSEGERIEENLDVYAGAEAQLECKVYPEVFADRTTEYIVADDTIVSVDNTGLVRGLKRGETLLTIQHASARKNIKVTVQPGVKAIEGLPEEVTLYVGDGYHLEPTVIMADTELEKPEITYKSKRTTIATVDTDGWIIAKEVGATKVTVRAGTFMEEIPITVIQRPAPVVTDNGA